jgi:pyruvate kinase
VSSAPFRHTRLMATLGPASRDPAILRRMVEEGLDWARLNFAHGDHDEQSRAAETLATVAALDGHRVRLLADLSGPKVRIGALAAPIELRAGEVIALGSGRDVPDAIPLTVPHVLVHRHVGEMLAVADGAIELEVVEVDRGWVRCRVAVGGMVRSYQGVAILGHESGLPPLTAKDHDDVVAALAIGVDAIALPRVRRREDVMALRTRVPDGVAVVARLEDADALLMIEGILQAADAIILARAGLACVMPRVEVALAQKEVLARCAGEGRMAIVATDLLGSMVQRPRPSRLEVSDVTTALLDGADALLLSEETAVGAHPVEAVAELRLLAETVEASPWYRAGGPRRDLDWPELGA